MEERRGFRLGVRRAAPLAVAVGGFGISFGLLTRSAGWGSIAPIVMSATTFAGSAQFAAASIMSAGGTTTSSIAAALLLNARYAPIGVSVAPSLSGGAISRLLHGQLTVDESWAIASEGRGRFDPKMLAGAGALLYVAWVTGTAIGAIGGRVLGDPRALGLDAAFPALFLALLVPQVRARGALVATQALSSGGSFEIDARLVGVIVAAIAIALALRAPVLLVGRPRSGNHGPHPARGLMLLEPSREVRIDRRQGPAGRSGEARGQDTPAALAASQVLVR